MLLARLFVVARRSLAAEQLLSERQEWQGGSEVSTCERVRRAFDCSPAVSCDLLHARSQEVAPRFQAW